MWVVRRREKVDYIRLLRRRWPLLGFFFLNLYTVVFALGSVIANNSKAGPYEAMVYAIAVGIVIDVIRFRHLMSEKIFPISRKNEIFSIRIYFFLLLLCIFIVFIINKEYIFSYRYINEYSYYIGLQNLWCCGKVDWVGIAYYASALASLSYLLIIVTFRGNIYIGRKKNLFMYRELYIPIISSLGAMLMSSAIVSYILMTGKYIDVEQSAGVRKAAFIPLYGEGGGLFMSVLGYPLIYLNHLSFCACVNYFTRFRIKKTVSNARSSLTLRESL